MTCCEIIFWIKHRRDYITVADYKFSRCGLSAFFEVKQKSTIFNQSFNIAFRNLISKASFGVQTLDCLCKSRVHSVYYTVAKSTRRLAQFPPTQLAQCINITAVQGRFADSVNDPIKRLVYTCSWSRHKK